MCPQIDHKGLDRLDELREQLFALANKARLVEPQAVGLPARALNRILARGINNSYDALIYLIDEIVNEHGIGKGTIAKSREATLHFLDRLQTLSETSVNAFMNTREILFDGVQNSLASCFPAIIDVYHHRECKINAARNADIITKRFGLNKSKRYTLDEIGTYYDVTRERIRQIEEKSIKGFRALISGEKKPRRWELSEKIVQEYNSLANELKNVGLFVDKKTIESKFIRYFGSEFDASYLDLLMEVLGYTKLPKSILGFRGSLSESWFFRENCMKKELEPIFRSLNVIYSNPSGIPVFELTVVAKKAAKNRLSNESLRGIFDLVVEFEECSDRIRLRFEYLPSVADKAARILEMNAKPLHFSKICLEINALSNGLAEFSPVKEGNLTNQLAIDDRFTPIGKSGEWGLSSWKSVSYLTIAAALEQILHQAGAPMQYHEIVDQFQKIRPDASIRSVKAYLNNAQLFTRTSKSTFALKSWRLDPVKKRSRKQGVPNSEIIRELKVCLSISNPTPFSRAIDDIAAVTKLSKISVRQRIAALQNIEIRKVLGTNNKEIYCHDIENIGAADMGRRSLLRERVQSEVRAILYGRANEPLLKGEIFKLITKNVDCIRPTFYQYLKEMGDIHQYRKEGKHYAVYNHLESDKAISIDISRFLPSSELQVNLSRALSKLTLKEVDIALYELGLYFEDGLRDYLKKYQENYPAKVAGRDLSRLVDMIECVVRLGIVKKGYHLNTLREERNNRAHGRLKTDAERQQLFNNAHYLADLFLKYICFFDNELKSL